jgi:hypothetical protein
MAKSLGRIKEEVRNILVAGLFFATGFCLIIISDRLLTRGSNIEIAPFTRAIIGGLLVAKVLLIVDLFPFVHAFPDKPIVHNIVWKSSLYVAASIVFTYLEPLIKSLFHGAGIVNAHHAALDKLTLPRTWAIEIWLAMLLVAFVTLQELTRVLGKERMRVLFFGERKRGAAAETRFRGAA